MKKIPTLYLRNPDNLSQVTEEVHPECLWVIQGEGVPLKKYDGTSCKIQGKHFYKRREVKKDKKVPVMFIEESFDPVTGKRTGWVPVMPEDRWHIEAWEHYPDGARFDGTYELVGPKINGNPENFFTHELLRHKGAPEIILPDQGKDTFQQSLINYLGDNAIEGIVWHHPDGRMAKIKRRDFGFAWPIKQQ